jgi:beta-glucosidase
VLVNGRPVTLNWIADSIPAILEAWFPSEEGANAIADVLFGDANPGGKLPISFPHSVGQIPVFYAHRPSGGRSHWHGDYVETSHKPMYPFGFGLSYTRFEFSNLRISPDAVRAGDEVTIQVDVTNVGERTGDEVVQVYTHQFAPRITRPIKELRAFKRVTIEPKQTQTVTFRVPVNQLSFYDHEGCYGVVPGEVDVMVGSSSRDLPCGGSFTIAGDKTEIGKNKVFFGSSHAAQVVKT